MACFELSAFPVLLGRAHVVILTRTPIHSLRNTSTRFTIGSAGIPSDTAFLLPHSAFSRSFLPSIVSAAPFRCYYVANPRGLTSM
ncbi:hypothetical protein F5Y05DRAFT_376621 [Hypoxylon sp. FL0543]|nr:hypothetical protein F5Y05DRAFT_376621 [Hypoxylon sp. FL0543]